MFATAVEAKREADDANARSWTVYNPSVLGPTGRPGGYSIVPVENAATIFPQWREKDLSQTGLITLV